MKKLYLLVGVILLALSMVACDLFESLINEPEEAAIYDAQGRRLVSLQIHTDGSAQGSRNMQLTTAQVAVNYYEVLFSNSRVATPATAPEYWRAAGVKGKVLTVRLPDSHYLSGHAINAIAFAGYWDKETGDRTLLATGTIGYINADLDDEVAVDTTTESAISTATRNIKFYLSSIETKFTTMSDSSFKITGVTPLAGDTPSGASFNSGAGGSVNEGPNMHYYTVAAGTPHAKYYPYWRLPANRMGRASTNITATFNYGINANHLPGIKVDADDAAYEFASWAVITDNADDGVTAVSATTSFAGFPTLAMPITMNIQTFEAPVHQGYCLLVPTVPVRAMNADPNNASFNVENDLWMLRNGLFDYEIHDHNNAVTTTGTPYTGSYPPSTSFVADPSLGGALLLCLGNPATLGGKAIRIIFSKINEVYP